MMDPYQNNCFINETWIAVAERISYSVILPLLFAFGFVGNCIILMVCLGEKQERKQTISIILSYVAISDNWMLLCSLSIFTFAKRLHFAVNTVPYVFALGQTCSTLSVWLDCFITFERFLAVCHPHKHRAWCDSLPKAFAILATLTLLAIVFELPRFWEISVEWQAFCDEYGVMFWEWRPQPLEIRETEWFSTGKLLVGYFTLNFIGPFLWQTLLNIKIVQGVRQASQLKENDTEYGSICEPNQEENTSEKEAMLQLNGNVATSEKSCKSDGESSTTTMLIAYSIAFLIMQFPAALLNVLEFLTPWIFAIIGFKWTVAIEQSSNLLIIMNSCTSCYIFLLFGTRFRQLVRKQLCSRFLKRTHSSNATESLVTPLGQDRVSLIITQTNQITLTNRKKKQMDLLQNSIRHSSLLVIADEQELSIVTNFQVEENDSKS